MKVLAVNCGSSTLKFQLLEIEGEGAVPSVGRRLAWGTVDRIGRRGAIQFCFESGECLQESAMLADHGEAARRVLGWLSSAGVLGQGELAAVGHRVVHGGSDFVEPMQISDETLEAIEAFSQLAPLHNRPALSAIRAARAVLGPSVPQVATFDTAFHSSMPDWAARYAIPAELAEKHNIRRYGFHGLAHRYMAERYATITSTPLDRLRLITLQLGNGCSATAIERGRSR